MLSSTKRTLLELTDTSGAKVAACHEAESSWSVYGTDLLRKKEELRERKTY